MPIGEKNPKLVATLAEYPKVAAVEGEDPVSRTSLGLRNALFDEIDALRRGDGDPQRALAIAQLAKTVLSAAKLEFQFAKSGTPMPKPLKLGGPKEPE